MIDLLFSATTAGKNAGAPLPAGAPVPAVDPATIASGIASGIAAGVTSGSQVMLQNLGEQLNSGISNAAAQGAATGKTYDALHIDSILMLFFLLEELFRTFYKYILKLSSTSPDGLIKQFYIACGYTNNAVSQFLQNCISKIVVHITV